MSRKPRAADASLILLPNVGGEEARGWRGSASLPAVRSLARLWCSLFDRAAQPLAADPTDLAAQEALRSPHATPAFEWLPSSAETAALSDAPQKERERERGAAASRAVAWYGGSAVLSEPALEGVQPIGPAPEVIDRVHDKAFALRVAERECLCPPALGACIAIYEPAALADIGGALAALHEQVRTWPEWARARPALKPRLGSSGRGRVNLSGDANPEDASKIRSALARLAARGGAILEPWLARSEDLSVVLRVEPNGDLHLLGSLVALIAESGRPLGHRGEIDSRGRVFSGSDCDDAMREAGAITASAAHKEGFHGPCGVDGFRYRDARGGSQLRAVCEFNARFTTGLVLLGILRRERERIREALSLRPGERAGFCFAWDEPAGPGCQSWQDARRQIDGASILLPLASAQAGAGATREACPALVVARHPAALTPLVEAVLARAGAA